MQKRGSRFYPIGISGQAGSETAAELCFDGGNLARGELMSEIERKRPQPASLRAQLAILKVIALAMSRPRKLCAYGLSRLS